MPRYEQNIVVDLEFTPIDNHAKTRKFKYEIIQIGAVRVGLDGQVLDSFVSYVKPEYTRHVSQAVRDLTGIKTCDICAEESLGAVIESFRSWVGSAKTRYVAWSDTDQKQLSVETNRKGIIFPEQSQRWLDLQKIYPLFMEIGNGRQMSLRTAADWHGIRVSKDKLHGALYDAMLTAELLSSLLTNDYQKQKESLTAVMPQKTKATSISLGEKFSCLSQLKQQLELAAA